MLLSPQRLTFIPDMYFLASFITHRKDIKSIHCTIWSAKNKRCKIYGYSILKTELADI